MDTSSSSFRRLGHHHHDIETTATNTNVNNSFAVDNGLNYEIEIFFVLLFILLAVIAIVKVRESSQNQFRYEPL